MISGYAAKLGVEVKPLNHNYNDVHTGLHSWTLIPKDQNLFTDDNLILEFGTRYRFK